MYETIRLKWGGTVVKIHLPTQVDARGVGSIPEEENVNPLQYSCLENSVDRGTWWATLHGVAKSWTTEPTLHVLVTTACHPRLKL